MTQSFWRVIFVSVAVLVFAAVFVISGAAAHINLKLLLAAVAVQPLNALSTVFISWRLLLLARAPAGFVSSFKAQCLAATFLLFAPGRISEIVKPLYLIERDKVPAAHAFAAVVIERLADVIIVAIAIVVTAFLTGGGSFERVWLLVTLLLFSVFGLIFVALAKPEWMRRLIQLLPFEKIEGVIVRLFDQCRKNLVPRMLLPALVLGIAAWLFSFLTTYLFLVLAADRRVSVMQGLIVFMASTVGLAISIAPGSAGTFEAAAVVSLKYCGFSVSEALALSIGMRIASQGLSLAIGVYVLAREKIGLKSFASNAIGYIRESSVNGGRARQRPAHPREPRASHEQPFPLTADRIVPIPED